MDLQLFLALNVIAICLLGIALTVMQRPPGYLGWAAVNIAVAAASGLALAFVPDHAGLVALVTFVPLVLAPAVLAQQSQRRSNMGRLRDAARFARLAAIFHPAPGTRFNAALMAALDSSEAQGDTGPLRQMLDGAAAGNRTFIEAMIARSEGRWDDIVDIAHRPEAARRDLAMMEIRALGELGRTDDMARCFEEAKPALVGYHLLFAQLFVLAFAGRGGAVESLLGSALKSLDDDTKSYWRAITALNTPGLRDEGRAGLARLAANGTRTTTRQAAERHLAAAAAGDAPTLGPAAQRILATTEAQVTRQAQAAGAGTRHAPLTLVLIALNGIAFAAEVAAGGSEDAEVLVRLGALWPPLVLSGGEWWRLLTPSFLHFGPVHLAANMLMLWVLGRMVEGTQGWRPLVAGYVVGGVGSTAAVLALMRLKVINYGLLIGASGAVMALFGMIVAAALVDWRRSRDVLDRRRLVSLAAVMAIQFAIDVSVPQISLAAHLSGFAIGLLLGLVLRERARA